MRLKVAPTWPAVPNGIKYLCRAQEVLGRRTILVVTITCDQTTGLSQYLATDGVTVPAVVPFSFPAVLGHALFGTPLAPRFGPYVSPVCLGHCLLHLAQWYLYVPPRHPLRVCSSFFPPA